MTNTTATTSFNGVAAEFAAAFVRDTRTDGTTYYRTAPDCPDWVDVREIHQAIDDRLPDDWIYEQIAVIASDLTGFEFFDGDAAREAVGEIADGLVDVYNADRTRWLADHAGNVALCDDAAAEYGGWDVGIIQRIGLGQYLAIERLAHAIITIIEAEFDQREQGLG